MNSPYFTIVLRIDPDVEPKTLMDAMDAIPGVKVSSVAWKDVMGDRDALALVLESQDFRLKRYREALEKVQSVVGVGTTAARLTEEALKV